MINLIWPYSASIQTGLDGTLYIDHYYGETIHMQCKYIALTSSVDNSDIDFHI